MNSLQTKGLMLCFLASFFILTLKSQNCNITIAAVETRTINNGDTACLIGNFFGTLTVESGGVLKVCGSPIEYNGTLDVKKGGLLILGSGTRITMISGSRIKAFDDNVVRFTGDVNCPAYLDGATGAWGGGSVEAEAGVSFTPDTNIWINSPTVNSMGNAKIVNAPPAACATPIDCDIKCLDVSTNPPAGPICITDSVNLTAMVATSEPGSWSVISGPAGSSISNGYFKATIGGTYTVRYTITGIPIGNCPRYSEQTVIVNNLPLINLGNDYSICIGDSTVIKAPSSMIDYTWSTGSKIDSIIVKTAGKYKVTITDANNCISEDSIMIALDTLPALQLRNDTTICDGNSIVLDAGSGTGYNYSWTPGGATSQTISITDSLLYKVVLTDGNNCSSTDSMKLNLYSLPTFSLANDTHFCALDSIEIVGPKGMANYNWDGTNGGDTRWVKNTGGTFKLTVTDGNSCSYSDSINITLIALPSVDLGNDQDICSDGSITIGITSQQNHSYLWQPGGQTTSEITVNGSGNYKLTVTNTQYNCVDSDDVVVNVVANPAVEIAGTDSIGGCFFEGQTDTAFIASSNGDILWNTGSTDDFAVADQEGWYWAQATNSIGCSVTDSVYFFADCEPVIFKLPNVFTPNGDNFNEIYTIINSNNADIADILANIEVFDTKIYNRWGTLVYENVGKKELPEWDGKYNGTPCSPGVYFIVVDFKDATGNAYKEHKYVHLYR